MLSRLVLSLRKKRRIKAIANLFTDKRIMELEHIIGCKIKNKLFYIQALVHRSYLEGNNEPSISNERLEFLGDSVLNLTVAEFLYNHFPEKDEGFLTKVRAKIVNRTALAKVAMDIKLDEFILIGKNLSQSFKSASKTVLADALEAVVGAMYLDSGIEEAKSFIDRILIKPTAKDDEFLIDENFKSQLLEYAQANKMSSPSYLVVEETGPQHKRIFTVKVEINGAEYGIGKGGNKKTAEQNAAKAAMKKFVQAE